MNRFPYRQLSLVLAILGLLIVGHPNAIAGTRQGLGSEPPRLDEVVVVPQQGVITVTGQDFTPGGQVYIALYDRWGVQLYETRWITASDEMFGLNGSRDPALGYVRGGTISEVFRSSDEVFGPDGSRDPARGYVPAVNGTDVSADAFGPDGSRDPAMINVANDISTELARYQCDAMLMVRALDGERDAWSNMLDIESGCD
jgi:hypothetical protein